MRFERAVAVLAGLGLAASGLPLVPRDDAWAIALTSPPFVMGAIVAMVAARPASSWLGLSDFVMMVVTAVYAVLSLTLIVYLVPSALVMFLATGYFTIVRSGAYGERAPRIVMANGAVWSTVFVLLREVADVASVELALICSVVMTVAGFAWWRATVRERVERNGPPLARVTRHGNDDA
ncbi:MAG TPA: hypothetical protein VL463_33815 [Kofleriaceae bacterium]|nr:hypothetical protein [Kofleriaceae bacterium]